MHYVLVKNVETLFNFEMIIKLLFATILLFIFFKLSEVKSFNFKIIIKLLLATILKLFKLYLKKSFFLILIIKISTVTITIISSSSNSSSRSISISIVFYSCLRDFG